MVPCCGTQTAMQIAHPRHLAGGITPAIGAEPHTGQRPRCRSRCTSAIGSAAAWRGVTRASSPDGGLLPSLEAVANLSQSSETGSGPKWLEIKRRSYWLLRGRWSCIGVLSWLWPPWPRYFCPLLPWPTARSRSVFRWRCPDRPPFTASRCCKGAEMCVAEINAKGGVLGKKIELLPRDSKANADEAVRVSRELIIKDNVDFLVGHADLRRGAGGLDHRQGEQDRLRRADGEDDPAHRRGEPASLRLPHRLEHRHRRPRRRRRSWRSGRT